METTIVYMVAGMSSRFGGKIKQFARIGPNNETLIEYSLNQSLKAGFNKIVFIVANLTEKPFKDMFGDFYKGVPIKYALQKFNPEYRDKPWGTVDALCATKGIVTTPFVVCNGDDIYGEQVFKLLAEHLKKESSGGTIGYELGKVLSPAGGGVNRGIYELTPNNMVKTITETFDITSNNLTEKNLTENSFCSMNIFALQPETLEKLNKILEKFKQDRPGDKKAECLLPEELSKLIRQEKLNLKLYPTTEKWFGVTNPEDELMVKKELKKV